jgi:NAD(P)-dependent dehydrogenase (short-subunit alcohol dehydrogenase family)
MTTNGNGRFTGKVAFATGAGNGIGRATPDRIMTHIAITEDDTEWGEHLTDAEYAQDPG